LIERAVPPLGFAGVAGHVDKGEDEKHAMRREIKEEVGLDAGNLELLFEEELDWNWCSRGVTSHYWYLFHSSVSGDLARSEQETKSAGWYSKEEIKKLTVEPVWEYWFKKMGVL
jgi:8-oxo-dGTP pyrophosphatase MutT (NUDIX family)